MLDRVIVITGASAGIGRAVAELAAADGAAVVLSARRADALDAIAAAITAKGGRALAVPGDVTRESDMTALVSRAIAAFGRVDVMLCNAGIGFHDRFEATTPEIMRRLVNVNLMGTLYAASAAMAHFRQRGAGHLIAVSSIVGRRGIAGSAVYAATKSAQIGLIEAIRSEVFGTNIHASVVYPVATRTEFRAAIKRDFGHEVRGRGPEQSAERVAAAIIECIRHPRPEVYPFPKAKWLSVVAVVAPRLADKLVQKYSRRKV
ncbi:MAG: SDR family NAD(P)-dependent oxidoreductase [Acidobacteria bacterium]|nr:MAG: SDR family NAD(P)-dependent oxidoreductase [Acidobacteriota bacterium]